jgi:hypothetical protein
LNSEKIWKLWKKSKLNMEIVPMRWQNPISRAAAAHFRSKGPTRADTAHAHPKGVTFGSHGTCTTVLHFVLILRKKHGKNQWGISIDVTQLAYDVTESLKVS